MAPADSDLGGIVAAVCAGVVERNLSGPLASGNVSAIDRARGKLMITARGAPLAQAASGLAQCWLNESLEVADVEGGEPSTELALHLAVYRAVPEAIVVVHLHSDWVVAAACLAIDALPLVHYHQALLGGEPTPVVAYATPGSSQLSAQVGKVLTNRPVHALLLANHGGVVVGSSPEQALERAEVLEHVCRLVVFAGGQARELDAGELTKLERLFADYGSA